MESTSLTTSLALGPFDMQQNNGLKFSRDRKGYIDFQLDVFGGGGWGYFENVQWTLCVKESICVRPLNKTMIIFYLSPLQLARVTREILF